WGDAACRRFPNLKVVARSGVGYDNVDVAACAAHGVAATNTPDAPTVSTAEHALALMLAVAKQLKRAEARLAAGTAGGPGRLIGPRALELDGRTLGLVGCGRIGSRLGRYGEALGMTVLVCDPYLDSAPVGELVSLDRLWASADVVSLHAPATPETRHIVNADSLAAMRPGVVIVNCARGSLVDQSALLAALEAGHVAGAGLDVTEPEPLPPDA
ncbi:MAG: phosphoglycerate dehydrogenase, partial [bacterium]|nr:phosphoglycerate dehydrogenase [bacterium]